MLWLGHLCKVPAHSVEHLPVPLRGEKHSCADLSEIFSAPLTLRQKWGSHPQKYVVSTIDNF